MFGKKLRRSLAVVGASTLAALVLPLAGAPAAAAAPSPGEVTVTQADNTTGCNGVRTTPGSENTKKILIGGTLVPGGTAIFQISFPFDPAKQVGQETFKMTDCVFIGVEALAKYFIEGIPNGESPFIFTVTLNIPADAPIGAEYCNYVKTTENPTAPNESNRKAGPACFFIGGDLRIIKVAKGDDSQTPLEGASFDVSCATSTGGETVPPVVISGLSGETTFDADAGAYVASGVAATGIIAIAGPEGTVCTVTETAPPAGYDLPDPATFEFTIPAGTAGQEIDFIADPLTPTKTPTPAIKIKTPAITPPTPTTTAPPLATTGAGPVNAELTWAVALLTLGGLLAAAGTRRYRRTH